MATKANNTMGSFFGILFGAFGGHRCRIEVAFTGRAGQPVSAVHAHGEDAVPLFSHGDSVCGQVRITPLQNGKLEHQGIRAQLVGVIDSTDDRHIGHVHEFLSLCKIRGPEAFQFAFRNVNMLYDSYCGHAVCLRYFVRVTLSKALAGVVKEVAFCVQNLQEMSAAAKPIKFETGIDNLFLLECEYDSCVYGLRDCVHGNIFVCLAKINFKKMELEVRRCESTGSGSNVSHNTVTLGRYEIKHGALAKGDTIPVRMCLAPFELTPSCDNHKKFSVKYYFSLVLTDMNGLRFFKQQEITLVRRAEQARFECEQ